MKALLIGTGAAGNKAVLKVLEQNSEIENEDVVLVNSTMRDIPKEAESYYNGIHIVILSQDNTGCGKERSIAKEITLDAIQSNRLDLLEISKYYDICVVVTSLEGGTGCGSAPIIAQYCKKVLGKNTHIIAFTGFEADVRGLQNSVEFFQEVDQDIIVQVIQNKAFLKKAGNVLFKAEQLANEELANRIKIIDGSLLNESDHNIDDTDIYKVVNTCGYMTVERANIDGGISDVADFNKICKQMIYESKSLKSENPGQARMGVVLNLSPESESAVDGNFTVFKEAYGTPYESFMHKQWDDALGEFIAVICSGMKMPLDEVKAIHQRYMEGSHLVNKDEDDFFGAVSELRGDASDARFDMGRPKDGESVSKDDFMKMFQPTKVDYQKPVSSGRKKKSTAEEE